MEEKTENIKGQRVPKKTAATARALAKAAAEFKPSPRGHKAYNYTSRYLGKNKGWTGLVNLKEFYDFLLLLGLDAGDVAKAMGDTRASINRWFRADDTLLSNLMETARRFGYKLTLEYVIPDDQEIFSSADVERMPEMVLRGAQAKRLYFLRKATQMTGVNNSEISTVIGFHRSALQHWFGIDDTRMSYLKRIEQVMGWELKIRYTQMSVRERAASEREAKRKAAMAASIPDVKDVFSSASPKTEVDRRFLEKFRTALEKGYSDPAFGPQTLARAFDTETHLLHARLMGLLGTGTDKVIMNYRVDRAAAMLKEGSCSCTGAAKKVGIKSSTKFYDNFRERYGMTPGDYATNAKIQKEMQEADED